MANSIALSQIFQQELDKQMLAEAATGWMEENASLAKYSGGNVIKIPKMSMNGLANYSRNNGFVDGAVTLAWETKTMRKDRGRSFTLDAMDVDESNFALSAGAVMGEFQRVYVVPEVDSYRIGELYTAAGSNKRTYTPASSSVFKELKADIATVQDKIGANEPLVIMMSIPSAALLDTNESVSRQIQTGEFRTGEVFSRVKMIDNAPILLVPSTRMKSAFTFYDGVTASDGDQTNPTPDQTVGGFVAASGAKTINWIICARTAPIGVSKTDTVRIFDPTQYQKAHAWKLDYRKYHDLWVPDNKADGVYINYQA